MYPWKIVVHVEDKRQLAQLASIIPSSRRTVDVFAKPEHRLRVGREFDGKSVQYVKDPAAELRKLLPEPGLLVLALPTWAMPSQDLFTAPGISDGDYACALMVVVDSTGEEINPTDLWPGTCVLGPGTDIFFYGKPTVFATVPEANIVADHIGPADLRERVREEARKHGKISRTRERFEVTENEGQVPQILRKRKIKIIDPEAFLSIVILRDPNVERVPWRYTNELPLGTESENEAIIRSIQSDWIALHHNSGAWTWRTVCEVAFARSDRDIIAFPGMTLVGHRRLRQMPPINPDVTSWVEQCRELGFRVTTCDISGSIISESGVIERSLKEKGLKVAVLSMCGVTSFEDRYGIGGEHQVVHWLKEGFDLRPDVEICDIYDGASLDLAPNGFYDLILSNSCWSRPPQTTERGTSIFWHFNTNAYKGDDNVLVSMGYDVLWSNSPVTVETMRKRGLKAYLKHLNASTLHHGLYPWESNLFHHDACYVGGYQTEYKGKHLIDAYVKPLCGRSDIDFAIYGNRKWRYDVQLAAKETDKNYFKEEHLDPSFEPHYKHVLHPDDFQILAKNAKVWVNFNAADQRPLGMCNDRCIWAMYCGAFFITDDTPEQKALYGDSCDYSTGGDDLVEKVLYWLPREDERRERGLAARENIIKRQLHTNATVEAAIAQHLRGRCPRD